MEHPECDSMQGLITLAGLRPITSDVFVRDSLRFEQSCQIRMLGVVPVTVHFTVMQIVENQKPDATMRRACPNTASHHFVDDWISGSE